MKHFQVYGPKLLGWKVFLGLGFMNTRLLLYIFSYHFSMLFIVFWLPHWCCERLRAEEEGIRRWDGWKASPVKWIWTWAISGWWWGYICCQIHYFTLFLTKAIVFSSLPPTVFPLLTLTSSPYFFTTIVVLKFISHLEEISFSNIQTLLC